MSAASTAGDKRRTIVDSPWFWVLLFSVTAWGALQAITGRFERRERGIEMRAAGRQEAAQRIARGEAIDPTRSNGPLTAPNQVAERDNEPYVYPEQFENDKSLGFLKWTALAVSVIAWLGLMVERRTQSTVNSTAISVPNEVAP